MFDKVLVANRGEIACRIIRTLEKLNIQSVAVYSEADRNTPHVTMASEAYLLGPAPVNESYLNADKIISIALETGAKGIHPGYGLLSENADFAGKCEQAGIKFIGPTPENMTGFGLKHEARRIVEESDGPLLPGTSLLESPEEAILEARGIGFPVMLKSTAGGGGIGMEICASETELEEAFSKVERLSQNHFGQGGIFLEKFIEHARHLEVQIFGDGKGRVITLGVRDCSSQRRNQKVIEETPPPNVSPEVLNEIQEAARRLGESVNYRSAGTVEFIYDNDTGEFYFLEVNTRLQVEHGVTELVTGVDLVEWMVNLASGDFSLEELPDIIPQIGHAIQARLYSENPDKDFQPSSGLLTNVKFPEGTRIDHWIESGTEVSAFYDPLLAKIQVHADSRPDAVKKLSKALSDTSLDGIETNLRYLESIVESDLFLQGKVLTKSLASHSFQPSTIEVLRGGTMTTVQDYPGRLGYWKVGVPPSGPMDSLSFRAGNEILGNDPDAAGLEITATGPRLLFNIETVIVVTGAIFDCKLDGEAIPYSEPVKVSAGAILDIGKVGETGVRAYLNVLGGLDVPEYLGSRSTFTLGQFGGHGGRALLPGDILHLRESSTRKTPDQAALQLPELTNDWEIGVLYGPHGAADFFTLEDIEVFFNTTWEVHYNSARTGVRLIGPKPTWARTDGGEAGLHPSNIHDNAYGIGTIDFTGDMPVILGPDGPSLGGFVCPATIVDAELWKIGQLKPGDRIRFKCLHPHEAKSPRHPLPHHQPYPFECILHDSGSSEDRFVVRQAGDAYMLAEIGDMKLDFKLRFHVHVLYEALKNDLIEGVIDLTPGIRSLQVHYDPAATKTSKVLSWLTNVNEALPKLEDITVPSRIVHLPLAWDDPSTQQAIQKYMQSVRPDAPWCPDNIEFIRRINGLDTREDVYRIVFDASYVVLGLGDVYLGAPVATPLDPRHRLVTTKYNPARTWTPENAVGIGGAYMCIYGMEGPGGYQFVGRTVQMWNRYKSTEAFEEGRPWLLRFFDQIKFYPVSAEELIQLRQDFPHGMFSPKIEETTFNLGDYEQFLEDNAESIADFKESQQSAFNEERARWEAAGLAVFDEEETLNGDSEDEQIPEDSEAIESHIAGNIWKILVEQEGATVNKGETIAIIESMKMEIAVEAPCSGRITGIYCKESQGVLAGQLLFAIATGEDD